MPEKIPIEFLLKYSRQEVGELKSEIDELKYLLKKTEEQNKSLTAKVKDLQKLKHYRSQQVQVENELLDLRKQYEGILKPMTPKKEKKLIKLYKRSSRTYSYWFNGCKDLLLFLQKLRNTKL